ncbi:MAG TPA: acyl-CoA dehydrogenase family protein [Myxococcota bacterium]|nr:acyl-CoA dehydrogenase family protein [Myxococcota bacterium]
MSTVAEQREFQEYAHRWLAENKPPPPPERMPVLPIEVTAGPLCDYLREWQRKCYDAGLVGADLPKEYGGGGHQGFQRIANREMSLAGTPYMVNVVALSMAIPTILVHGTEEQKKRFVPRALRCDEIWCQGFSEPGAGSDLASAQTSAVRDGDDWVVNGHKVWTSLGHIAQWMILLARTSKAHKYDGLTYFLCPIEGHPGVTVKPLIKMTGDRGFNEVFFENVRIPDSLRLDAVGKGWTVAMTTLTYERGAAEGAGGGGGDRASAIERLIHLARQNYRNGVRASDDPHTRDALVQRAIVHEGMMQNVRRSRVPALCDHPMRLPLQMKVTGSEYAQHNARLGCEIAGARSTLYKLDPAAPDAARWPIEYLDSYGHTIAAGTNEIQRNILGERVLGLPKSK